MRGHASHVSQCLDNIRLALVEHPQLSPDILDVSIMCMASFHRHPRLFRCGINLSQEDKATHTDSWYEAAVKLFLIRLKILIVISPSLDRRP